MRSKPSHCLPGYDPGEYWCELVGRNGAPTNRARLICERLAAMDEPDLRRRAQAAERELYNLGITFTVYSDRDAIASCPSTSSRAS